MKMKRMLVNDCAELKSCFSPIALPSGLQSSHLGRQCGCLAVQLQVSHLDIRQHILLSVFIFEDKTRESPTNVADVLKGIVTGQPALVKTVLALGNLQLAVLQRGYLEKVNMNIPMPDFPQLFSVVNQALLCLGGA